MVGVHACHHSLDRDCDDSCAAAYFDDDSLVYQAVVSDCDNAVVVVVHYYCVDDADDDGCEVLVAADCDVAVHYCCHRTAEVDYRAALVLHVEACDHHHIDDDLVVPIEGRAVCCAVVGSVGVVGGVGVVGDSPWCSRLSQRYVCFVSLCGGTYVAKFVCMTSYHSAGTTQTTHTAVVAQAAMSTRQ